MDISFRLAFIVMILAVQRCSADRQTPNTTCDICDCSFKYNIVNCSNKGLEHIPRDIDNHTVVLDLSSNYLQHIDEGSLESLTKLVSLNLYNTSLKKGKVSADAFKGLMNLKSLDISHNDQFPLSNISTSRELFRHVPSLEVLRMFGTTGTYNVKNGGYPDEQLSEMVNLTELWIDGFTNSAFGPAFRNMTSLRILRLAGDYIEPLWRSNEFCMINDLNDGMLDNLVSVTHLYVRKCYVKKIGKNAFKNMVNLEYLDMSMNNKLGFEQLFESFCSLPIKTSSLILNEVATSSPQLCGNHITESMAKCINDKPIRELQLNYNVILYIEPSAFSKFPPSIETASITKNEFHLGFYMFYIFNMKNLTRLDMSYQFFTDATSIWQNHNGIPKAANTHCTKSYDSKYKQSDEELKATNPADSSKELLNENNDIRPTDEYTSDRNNILQHKRHQDVMSRSNFQNEKPKYKTRQISRQNTQKVCPQHDQESYIPPGTFLINVPPKLEYLDISHSKAAHPIFEIYVNKTNNLLNINVSNSLVYCWDGPVHGLTKLAILDLSSNFCTNVSIHFFEKLTNLSQLNISYNFLGSVIAKDVKGQLMANLQRLENLDMSFNQIDKLPALFLKSQKEMRTIIGKINMIEEFNVDIAHMTKLTTLDLKANRIRTLSIRTCKDLEMISKSDDRIPYGTSDMKLYVDLRDNPIECSCDNVGFIKWLYKYYDSNSSLSVNVSYCHNYENHRNHVHLKSQNDLQEMVDFLELHCRSYTSLIVGLSVTLAIMINVILGIIVHRFRWKLQYWYYVVFNRKIKRQDGYELIEEPRYKYDVFVASTEDQKEFVVDKLRPVFKRNGLMAFLSVYHINYNDRLVHTIGKAINESRVVLFLFSNDWSTDHCMNIAVHMWQCDMIQRKRRPVLGIYLNNMTGADVFKVQEIYCSTFIDFPIDRHGQTDEEEQEAFWIDCVRNVRQQGELQ